MVKKTFGKRLTALREQSEMTQAEFAARCGISDASFYSFKSGRRVPTLSTLVIMANELNVTLDYLLGLDDAEPPKVEARKLSREMAFYLCRGCPYKDGHQRCADCKIKKQTKEETNGNTL